MSQQNVELVREVIALMNRRAAGEPDPRLFDLFAPEVQIDMSRRIFNPDVYQGHTGLRRFCREVRDVREGFSRTPARVVDAGESVIVLEAQSGRARARGAAVADRSAVIWTVGRGRVIRVEVGLDPQEALELVRLRK
jgi:ketosteroid isomerase-like protein